MVGRHAPRFSPGSGIGSGTRALFRDPRSRTIGGMLHRSLAALITADPRPCVAPTAHAGTSTATRPGPTPASPPHRLTAAPAGARSRCSPTAASWPPAGPPAGQAAVARFTAAGELDTTWGSGGRARRQRPERRHPRGADRPPRRHRPARRDDARRRQHAFAARRAAHRATASWTRRFATAGKLITTSGAETTLGNLAVTADGHILVAATSSGGATTDRAACSCKLTAAGARDTTFGTNGEVGFRLGGADTTFNDIALDGAERIYLAGSRATTPRHQMVVARLTTAGVLDTTYGTHAATRSPTSTAPPRPPTRSPPSACASTPNGTALVVSTVQARPALAPDRPRPPHARRRLDALRHAGTRTQDVSPSHITDATSLVDAAGAASSSAAPWPSAPPRSSALAGYHEDGIARHHAQPRQHDRRQRGQPRRRHRRRRPHRRARRHPAGPPARGGHQPDAERAEPQRDRPPRRRRPRPAGQRQGHVGAGRARPRGPARPDRRLRRVRLDRPRRPDRQVRVGHRRRRHLRAHRREGPRQLPGADRRRRARCASPTPTA